MIRTPSKVMMVSSSPGRAEKLPAPMLATLLRGKGGSRSRGRSSSSLSRSSPMFVARRRSASASSVDIQEEKEPSSPKVTCIGQVRISKRKSSSSSSSSSSSTSKQQQKQGRCAPQGCRCLQRSFFWNPFSRRFSVKLRPASAPSPSYRHHAPRGWRSAPMWLLLPRSGCYRQRNAPRQRQQQLFKEDGPRTKAGGAPAAKAGSDDEGERSEQGEVEEDEEVETRVFVPTNPPKNALLLMRCRSAPHRAACLSDRLWASSPQGVELVVAAGTAAMAPRVMAEPSHRENNNGQQAVGYYSVSSYGSSAGINDGAEEPREGEEEDGETAAVGPSPSFSSRPLILTRCKSEPARRAAKLAAPEASYCFWNSSSSGNQINKARNKNSNNKRWLTLLGEARPIPSQ